MEVLVSYRGAQTHPWLRVAGFTLGCSHRLGLLRFIDIPGHSEVLPESFTSLKAAQNQPGSDSSGVTRLIYPSAQTRRGYCSQQQELGLTPRNTSSSSGALFLHPLFLPGDRNHLPTLCPGCSKPSARFSSGGHSSSAGAQSQTCCLLLFIPALGTDQSPIAPLPAPAPEGGLQGGSGHTEQPDAPGAAQGQSSWGGLWAAPPDCRTAG